MTHAILTADLVETIGLYNLLMLITAVVFFFLLITAALKCYRRCPSNKILVVWGKGTGKSTAQTIHGGARLVIPVLQDYAYLSLDPLQIEIPLKGALSAENIRVNVPSVFTVAIGTEPDVMQNAAIRLLGLRREEVRNQASDIIFGQLRQVIASMKIEQINRDRDVFLEKTAQSLEPELQKIGLTLINVNITDITDDSGYIEAIGRKAASTAVQQAEIDVAEQEKHGAIGVAKARQEQAIQVADAEKNREIGTKSAEQQKTIRVAELLREQQVGVESARFHQEAEVKQAERDMRIQVANLDREERIGVETAKFQQEATVKQAERDMRIQLADADAQAIAGENKAKAHVAATNSELAVKQAEAYLVGETKKREAEAGVQEAQFRAQAKAALADAERVEAQKRAELEAPAKAEKARVLVAAEAEAERRRIEAQGEAKAIFAKLEAEARGEYEILSKKAKGLGEIVSACGGSQAAFQLLMLEHMEQLSKTAAQAISNIKFDKVIVWENGGANGSGATAGFLRNMAQVLPPVMQIMQDIGGVKMPEYFGQMNDNHAADANGSAATEAAKAPRAEPAQEAEV